MTGQPRIELTDQLIERMVVERSGSRSPADLVPSIVSAIEATPQRRAPFLPWLHLQPVQRPAWILVGAVLALLLLGAAVVVGSYLLRPQPGFDASALNASWSSVGTRVTTIRNGTHTLTPSNRVDIVFTDRDVHWGSFKSDVFNAMSIVGSDTMELRLPAAAPADWNCLPGDLGTYRFLLTSQDQHLTLTAIGDACAERAKILGGEWIRTDMGDLAPGKHVAALFRPFADPPSGQLSYTTPSGWAEGYECATCLYLASDSDVTRISVWSVATPSVGDAGCATPADVGRTAIELTRWLANRPGLVATAATSITIGDLSGFTVDLSLVPGWIGTCGDSSVLTFTDADGSNIAVFSETRDRYVVLDRGDGESLVIIVQAPDDATWGALMAAAMPIVESFEFSR
jgi:hypothetical protein